MDYREKEGNEEGRDENDEEVKGSEVNSSFLLNARRSSRFDRGNGESGREGRGWL